MIRSMGRQSAKSAESVLKKKRKATVGKICRNGVVVRALDLRLKRSQVQLLDALHFQIATLGKLFTHMCLCHKAI